MVDDATTVANHEKRTLQSGAVGAAILISLALIYSAHNTILATGLVTASWLLGYYLWHRIFSHTALLVAIYHISQTHYREMLQAELDGVALSAIPADVELTPEETRIFAEIERRMLAE